MKTFALLLLAMAAAAVAVDENEAWFAPKTTYSMGGGCPASCSGHGYCRADSKCFCFEGWLGFDCSKRECPSYPAWGVDSSVLHEAVECSYRGVCDRASGQCKCFEGYEGAACERTSCPNDCSGHGKCRFISELTSTGGYTAWDKDRVQTCVCDGGYMGSDCSLRMCPYGNDPQSICTAQDYQVQKISIAYGTTNLAAVTGVGAFTNPPPAGEAEGDLVLAFTDSQGNTWKTAPIANIWDTAITSASTVSTAIATALSELPNFTIDSVSVSTGGTTDTNLAGATLDIYVTFSGSNTPGDQALLTCATDNGCSAAGCAPKFNQLRVAQSSTLNAQTDVTLVTPNVLLPSTGSGFADSRIDVTVVVDATADTYTVQIDVDGVAGTASTAQKVPSSSGSTKGIDIGYGLQIKIACTNGNCGTSDTYTWSLQTPTCTSSVEKHAGADNENIECSGRGICDRSSGMCSCFNGYTGYACATQMIVV